MAPLFIRNTLIFSEPISIINVQHNKKYGKIIILVLEAIKPKIGA